MEVILEQIFGETSLENAESPSMQDDENINGDAHVGEQSDNEENGAYECIPDCDESIKPLLGQRFSTLDEGVGYYKEYAAFVGFDVRSSTVKKNRHGDVELKYLLCSREGYTVTKEQRSTTTGEANGANINTRRRVSNRVGCMARCALKRLKDGHYAINVLIETHKHRLCDKEAKKFLKINRNLGIGHQAFIAACEKANIGTSKAFELYSVLGGGVDSVGATCIDFRNCRRDVQAQVHDADAQSIIEKYTKKKTLFATYTFDYDVDAEQKLCRVFWCDPIAKQNYLQFGEMVSFDATYRTNRYKMVFVPFTGIDNHKKCVTFGAGLISREDKTSYAWLLNAFKRCMGQPPTCIITDQDPALKEVVPEVFPESRHRFCMWHIMTKLVEKMGVTLAKDETFRTKLNGVVWNETLGREDFERSWHAIMGEYGLEDNR
ncbi:protein FAR1-RELATED SEQUENCE 5-like [Ipomoea triloba]|uniref:protein FAR1-RELATED SEQUENCE 5-like n=1 Tax=Ipomoea triloba TaxID=35885 RepID=UPI00125CF10C|nr:protein FAR1-RELATED SEQUENCE 5-like [Ipomoea triloba]